MKAALRLKKSDLKNNTYVAVYGEGSTITLLFVDEHFKSSTGNDVYATSSVIQIAKRTGEVYTCSSIIGSSSELLELTSSNINLNGQRLTVDNLEDVRFILL